MAPRLTRADYTVGWVSALSIELAAAQEMLDEEHENLPQPNGDSNNYSFGRVGEHNVVIACLPDTQTGIGAAATVATQMLASFASIRFGLMVGVGGGVPSDADLRLGDVVVSRPGNGYGGVIQYDFGKQRPGTFERTGFLSPPPPFLLGALTKLRALHFRSRGNFSTYLAKIESLPKFSRAQAGPDILYNGDCVHDRSADCKECLVTRVDRSERSYAEIHYGTIASGNQVMRFGKERDKISKEFGGVLCFEMEAAGLMNNFPCLVIRGICDYSDSHKTKMWQPYAAGAAGAYAKDLLMVIPPGEVAKAQTAQEATHVPQKIVKLPFSKNHHFVGRKATLETIQQKLFIRQDCQRLAIVGLGGIGKTQVALSFAYHVKDRYPDFSIFWIPAVSKETVEQAFGEIARLLHIRTTAEDEDVKVLVRQHLSTSSAGKWLLFVDNADDEAVLRNGEHGKGLLEYLPRSDCGLIVFTTRDARIAQSVVGRDVVELEKMQPQEARDYLTGELTRPQSPEDTVQFDSLLTELDYHPLAITQAAAYMNTKKIPLAEYLRLLRNTEQDLVHMMSSELADSTRYDKAANAVASTWVISFEQIAQDDAASDLLEFMSCIEWKAIPYSMLPTMQPEARKVSAIGVLTAYSFVSGRHAEKAYDMHRLVHLASRIWYERCGRVREIRQRVIGQLSDAFPESSYENRVTWRRYLPHLARVDRDAAEEENDELSWLRVRVGQCLEVDGRIKEALAWFERANRLSEAFSEDHPSRLASQHALAEAYQANGQIKEAVELLEHVVGVKAGVLDADHPSRLASQHALAGAYEANGQIKEAVKMLEHVVGVEAGVLDEDHPSRLASQHALAGAYRANGQIKEAVKMLEHVIGLRKKVLEEDHPDRLASQHALAGAYRANGQIKEAVELLEHVVGVKAGVLDADHPSRLASQHALAGAYEANGQIKEAVKMLEHVVGVEAGVLDEDHPDRLASQHALAGAYEANGQIKEAVKMLEHVVGVEAGVLDEDHPDRLASQHALAGAYEANGQIKEAVKMLEHVVGVKAGVLDEDHPSRLASQHALAGAYEANGQIKGAVKMLEHVVGVHARVFEEDHPSRLASQHALAGAYRANGQIKEAVKMLEHVVGVKAGVLDADHPSRLASQHALAGAYEANGQIKEAVKMLEHVVGVKAGVLDEDHPSRLASQHALAGAYEANGQIKEAVKMLEHVVGVHARVFEEDHPSRLASQHALAGAYRANGQIKEAVELLEHVVGVRKGVLSEDHPDRLASMSNLATYYYAQERLQEAQELMTVCVEAQARILGATHPATVNSVAWLETIGLSIQKMVLHEAQSPREEVDLGAENTSSESSIVNR